MKSSITSMTKKIPKLSISVLRLVYFLGISYTILYPLLSKLALVFMEEGDLADMTVKWIPRHYTFDNIKVAVELMDYGKSLLYTFVFCLFIAVLQITVCTLTAYGFGRYRSKLRSVLFILVLATLLIPPQTYIVTLYTQFQYFDFLGLFKLFTGETVNVLTNSIPTILLSAFGMGIRAALFIYMESLVFKGLPKELEEAAKVDGAGTFTTFSRVMLPNVKPIMVCSFILAFSWQWKDTFYANHFGGSGMLLAKKNVVVLASNYLGGWDTVSSSLAGLYDSVGNLLITVPLIILFIICQKSFIQSAEHSGIVG